MRKTWPCGSIISGHLLALVTITWQDDLYDFDDDDDDDDDDDRYADGETNHNKEEHCPLTPLSTEK